MTETRVQRRLAAILAADVVGFSRLMGKDEAGTLHNLKTLRAELIDPKIAEHSGRIFKTTGDGLLVEFPSIVNAVACAVDIQRGMQGRNADLQEEKAIQLRIGVNLGDVIVEGDDIFGDGVNVAARLEGIAPVGGVAISGTVRDHVGNKLDLRFDELGEQSLKNIATPVRAFAVRLGSQFAAQRPALALPNKPSIAVLPFQNMSGDPEQEYFADGMVEEIITALSRFNSLFVIARNSSFTYKGRAVDVKQVGRELGVRYILEGSVRKAGTRVRITGQLVDTSTGIHVWAERFDGALDDIFDLQDQVTASVVGAIAPKLEQAEIERSMRKPTGSLDAYDYFLRGMAGVHRWTRESNAEALAHFYRAIELDPNFASAYGLAARCYAQRRATGWVTDRARETAEAERLARLAVELGRNDAVALSTAGIALAFVVGDLDGAADLIDRALVLNPNFAWAWLSGGWVKNYQGEPEAALERMAHAMRLSPQDFQLFNMQAGSATAHFFAGRYAEALSWAESAQRQKPNFLLTVSVIAASAGLLGRTEQGLKAIESLQQIEPTLRVSNVRDFFPIRRPEHLAKLTDGLRKAGLHE